MKKIYKVIGLMSGTSLDGVDVAMIETDGYDFVRPGHFLTMAYDIKLREKIRACFGKTQRSPEISEAERELTEAHVMAVQKFLEIEKIKPQDIDLIGFHGQTISHDPKNGFTWQIGLGNVLAETLDINVVADFRSADVKAGGQGAPLIPLYHRALIKAGNISEPVAVLNIGGVSNITYIEGDQIFAFDCGPGNALLDDEILRRTGQAFDYDGLMAAAGKIHENLVTQFLTAPYFSKSIPKSLDRNEWDLSAVSGLSLSDALATLSAFTVAAIIQGLDYLPHKPKAIYVTGGGRHNSFMMRLLAERSCLKIAPVEALGWNGDALEAEGFGYLAVRHVLGLPLSLPTTTGVKAPQTGGEFFSKKA